MARRSRQSFLKRQRERQRAEKAAEKRQKRFERHRGNPEEPAGEGQPEGPAESAESRAPDDVSDRGEQVSAPVGALLDGRD